MSLTTQQAARQLGISKSRVRKLADEERIAGAAKHGQAWIFPDDITVAPRKRGRPPKRQDV